MKYKTDWPEAQRRLTALWNGERLDRPCIAVRSPQAVDNPAPIPAPADEEARWLDPAYRQRVVRRELESTWWGGETIPSSLTMAGWMVCLSGTPHFAPDTIWFLTQDVDFAKPSPFRHDPESVWMRKYGLLMQSMCAMAGRDDFQVGHPLILPANDLLSMHLGTDAFMLALMDHPKWMEEAILNGAVDQLRAKQQLQAKMRADGHDYWYGMAGWMPFWAPEPFSATQSDVSCMLSPEMFDQFIMPEMDVLGAEHNALWYHLDGGNAKQHLPRLLSLPYLRVIQYVPTPGEPPNGPGHLEMYKQIQAAGKIVHIELPCHLVEPLVRELDPSRLMLQTRCFSCSEGEQLIEKCVKWTA